MPGRRLVVEADGGSRGNPGVAGYGALVRDAESGVVLAERAAPLGKRSNNVAEYRGLIAGLERVVTIDAGAQVEVKMDSKLVIEQMAGRWKIKHEDMRTLALEARDLVRQIQAAGGSVRWTWIPREVNKAADKLSNDGMDGRTIDRLVGEPAPAEVEAAAGVAVVETGPERPAPRPEHVPSAASVVATPAVAMTGAVRILLVRHGSTAMTSQGRLSGGGGLSDPSLTQAGHREAEAAARVVAACLARERTPDAPPPRIVTSALARARVTGAVVSRVVAGLLDTETAPVVDEAWDEQGFGFWDGLTVDQVRSRWPQAWAGFVDAGTDPADQHPPGGESTAELVTRIQAAYAALLGTPGDVVVVTSRRPILAILALALGSTPARMEAFGADPGSVTAVEVQAGGAVTVPFVNRTGSLG